MKLTRKLIKEISDFIDSSLTCFVHKETHELITIPDPYDPYYDEEPWLDSINEIEQHREKYIEIEKLSSHESFKIMRDFTDQVEDKKIKNKLIYALERNKPFRNFKYEVDYDEETRQHWFKYKQYRIEEYVKDYLENFDDDNEGHENEGQVISGYFNDDGTRIDPNLYPMPNLCLTCKFKDDPNEKILCNLTRSDQEKGVEFKCYSYHQL